MDLSGPGIDVKLKERKKKRWNLGHSLLTGNFACNAKTAFDFLEQNLRKLSMESWALRFG